MQELFADFPDALANALMIAKRCDLDLKLGTWVFPAFPIPAGSSAQKELNDLAEKLDPRRFVRVHRLPWQRFAAHR